MLFWDVSPDAERFVMAIPSAEGPRPTFNVPSAEAPTSAFSRSALQRVREVCMRCLTRSFPIMVAVVLLGAYAVHSTPVEAADGACGMLTQADILKAAGLKVSDGVAGAAIPGTLGRCTWTAGTDRVIVTLADAPHMQRTIAAEEQSGGTSVAGLGSKAVAIKGAAFTGGGYIVSVVDAKGGFGVSLLGPAGTLDRVVALARVVESHR